MKSIIEVTLSAAIALGAPAYGQSAHIAEAIQDSKESRNEQIKQLNEKIEQADFQLKQLKYQLDLTENDGQREVRNSNLLMLIASLTAVAAGVAMMHPRINSTSIKVGYLGFVATLIGLITGTLETYRVGRAEVKILLSQKESDELKTQVTAAEKELADLKTALNKASKI